MLSRNVSKFSKTLNLTYFWVWRSDCDWHPCLKKGVLCQQAVHHYIGHVGTSVTRSLSTTNCKMAETPHSDETTCSSKKDISPHLKGISRYNQENIRRAVETIMDSDALLITAGAGMGVDSGLPDFRGPQGFWKAYPPLKERGLTLPAMSNPQWFEDDPEFAWGFFGHRYNLYSNTEPHEGFQILKSWAEKMAKGHFVFTSNVDGHFQKAGFPEDKITECHGSINYLQCTDADKFPNIWPVPAGFSPQVDEKTLRAKKPLPLGPDGEDICLARPNIMMFGDWSWVSYRSDDQYEEFCKFKKTLRYAKLAVVECGAGLSVPTVRAASENQLEHSIVKKGVLIRINPREPDVPEEEHNISIELGARAALKAMNGLLKEKGWY
ncbi:NAD-dependent protein deacylase-like [Lineus longissimus]|uniref:NAD-dependent protein deacylase-like n=1 Tax=Lineus longissimus TaxID=88925 RepID=UPI00315CF441